MSIPFLIYVAFGILMIAYFYVVRTSPTYTRVAGIAMMNGIIGIIALAIELVTAGTITIVSLIIIGLATVIPAVFRSYSLIFNFDREIFDHAVEDSARKLLMEPPVWTQNRTSFKSRDATLRLSLWVRVYKAAIILYAYEGSRSKKLELYKQLLAKHFYRALPRIKINAK